MITEKWEYLRTAKGLLCFTINYSLDSTDFWKVYYLDKGELVYAKEGERMNFPSFKDFIGWAGSFYFSKGKLIDFITLGHGKSEVGDWDPEKDTFKMFKRRYKEYLAEVKKESN